MAPPRKPRDVSQRHAPPKALALRPKNDIIVPEPPGGLLKPTREIWTRLFESDVARAIEMKSDLPRLERWIRLVDDWHRTHSAVRREPMVAGSKGQRRVNPLAGHLRFLEDAIARTETEFGLTPRARAQLGITLGQAALTAADVNRLTDTETVEFDPEFSDA